MILLIKSLFFVNVFNFMQYELLYLKYIPSID
jgi:hypothetical protein